MMALTVTVTRPGGYVDVLANDSAFVQRANAACGPGLRSVSRSDRATPGGLPVMATATSAATVDRDADTVAAIGGRLAAIPVTPAAGAAVAGWLAGWSRYAMGLHQVASYLRSHAEGPPPAQLVDQTTAQAAQIDGFALSNGIWACTLLPADRSPAGTGA